jgi:hypothetical protein
MYRITRPTRRRIDACPELYSERGPQGLCDEDGRGSHQGRTAHQAAWSRQLQARMQPEYH